MSPKRTWLILANSRGDEGEKPVPDETGSAAATARAAGSARVVTLNVVAPTTNKIVFAALPELVTFQIVLREITRQRSSNWLTAQR